MLLLLLPILFPALSTFTENQYSVESAPNKQPDSPTEHSSALLSFRFPLEFRGQNSFLNNLGGGLVMINSRVRVQGELLFQGNRATFGGGIGMDDSCLVCFSNSTY